MSSLSHIREGLIEYKMNSDDEIKFSDKSVDYCVCIIDMVNSTYITAQMTKSSDIKRYYGIFINTMATIARNFEGKVIKNSGDSVIYYFPNTSDSGNEYAFRNVLECCLTMIAANSVINEKMYEESLPPIKYRISADYGKVQVAKSNTSVSDDLFGTTVNLCAKINRFAEPNSIIIGGDLYLVLKSITMLKNDYNLKAAGYYSLGVRGAYPLYSVTSRYIKPAIGDFMQIPELGPVATESHRPSSTAPLSSFSSSSTTKEIVTGSRVESEESSSGAKLGRVMLVDDDQDILATFEALLSSQNIIVDCFKDAKYALKQFALAEPGYYNLVILDIRMPGLNGLQLYYRIKGVNKDIKVLFVSALEASEELISILPGIQAENILKKPVERNYFISTVRTILQRVTEGGLMTK